MGYCGRVHGAFYKEYSRVKSPYRYLFGEDRYADDEDPDVNLIGLTEQQEFVNDYGVYMELIYLILNGDMMRMSEVFSMKAHEFLFVSEYLYRKQRIENRPKKNI